jgi:hypothetical protein
MVIDEQRLPRVHSAEWSKHNFIPLPEGGAEDAHELGLIPQFIPVKRSLEGACAMRDTWT